MFNKQRRRETAAKGTRTRQHVLETALALFRRHGFERTTMRDIARAADLSLGAAYHYFPSKDALVAAYYDWLQDAHEAAERAALEAAPVDARLGLRLDVILRTKLDLVRRDRKLLAALFRDLGDASHPLSVFGRKTAALRRRSVAQFAALCDDARVPDELRQPLGHALWLAHLGVCLFFIHDTSPRQARTQALVDALVELVPAAVALLGSPFGIPLGARLITLARQLASPAPSETSS